MSDQQLIPGLLTQGRMSEKEKANLKIFVDTIRKLIQQNLADPQLKESAKAVDATQSLQPKTEIAEAILNLQILNERGVLIETFSSLSSDLNHLNSKKKEPKKTRGAVTATTAEANQKNIGLTLSNFLQQVFRQKKNKDIKSSTLDCLREIAKLLTIEEQEEFVIALNQIYIAILKKEDTEEENNQENTIKYGFSLNTDRILCFTSKQTAERDYGIENRRKKGQQKLLEGTRPWTKHSSQNKK